MTTFGLVHGAFLGWPDVPSPDLLCRDDLAVGGDRARRAARDRLATAVELPGGHSPFLSRPTAFAGSSTPSFGFEALEGRQPQGFELGLGAEFAFEAAFACPGRTSRGSIRAISTPGSFMCLAAAGSIA